jgi:hypothetical protein
MSAPKRPSPIVVRWRELDDHVARSVDRRDAAKQDRSLRRCRIRERVTGLEHSVVCHPAAVPYERAVLVVAAGDETVLGGEAERAPESSSAAKSAGSDQPGKHIHTTSPAGPINAPRLPSAMKA